MKKFITTIALLSTLIHASSWVDTSKDVLAANESVGTSAGNISIFIYDRKNYSIENQDPDVIRENLKNEICKTTDVIDGHYINFVYLYRDGTIQVTITCE